MSKAPRKPAAGTISGVRALAAALKVSHVAVASYVKHDDWPFGPGPWSAEQVAQMREWQSETLRPANAPKEDDDKTNVGRLLNKAKFKKIVRETELLEIRAKIMNGDYVDRATMEADHVRKFETIKRNIRAVPDGLPYDASIKAEVLRHIDRQFDLLSR